MRVVAFDMSFVPANSLSLFDSTQKVCTFNVFFMPTFTSLLLILAKKKLLLMVVMVVVWVGGGGWGFSETEGVVLTD